MANEQFTEYQKIFIWIFGITIGFGVIYTFWALVIGFLAWAFNFNFEWSYPAGFAVLYLILKSVFNK